MNEFTMAQVEQTENRELLNIYVHWLRLDGVSDQDIRATFKKYHIGVSRKHVHGGMYSPIFWQIDINYNVLGGRTLGIADDKRIIYSRLGRASLKQNKSHHLFGEHLLSVSPDRPVKIFPFETFAIRNSLKEPGVNCLAIITTSEAIKARVREYLPGAAWVGC